MNLILYIQKWLGPFHQVLFSLFQFLYIQSLYKRNHTILRFYTVKLIIRLIEPNFFKVKNDSIFYQIKSPYLERLTGKRVLNCWPLL